MKAEIRQKMSFKEAVDFLGYKKSYLYQLTSKRKIPFSKPTNGKIFFDREKLEAWLLGSSVNDESQKEETQQVLFDIALKAVKLSSLSQAETSKQLSNG